MPPRNRPIVVITGACNGIGRQCADLIGARDARLVLADIDSKTLTMLGEKLGATTRYCDVASEASVTCFAAEVLGSFPQIDMLINAAGGGYERTLGMYRVSRALLPALKTGRSHNFLLNIPPAERHAGDAIFPYASSRQAFQRLCAALAAETRGSPVRVLIGRPADGRLREVLPDHNAGFVADACDVSGPASSMQGQLAARIAMLLEPAEPMRRAG